MHEDITNRVHKKIALKQKKRHGQIECMLRDNFEAGCYVLEGLSDCDEKKTTTILNIINMNALERRVIHVWYDSNQKLDVTWNGRIKRVEKQMVARDPLLVIIYWEKDQCEEEGEEEEKSYNACSRVLNRLQSRNSAFGESIEQTI